MVILSNMASLEELRIAREQLAQAKAQISTLTIELASQNENLRIADANIARLATEIRQGGQVRPALRPQDIEKLGDVDLVGLEAAGRLQLFFCQHRILCDRWTG